MNQNLNQRNLRILNTIIEEYISTAAPVGSKIVAQKSDLKLSPASMRSGMAELTELGFLEQPHTSAGRIPTSKAFRLYIDSLLYLRPFDEEAETAIVQSLASEEMEINSIFRRAAGLMADRCNQVSMLLAPERKSARWSGIGFTKSGRNKVLAVLALEGGMVETRLISTDSNFSVSELLRFSNYLNSHFKGMSLWAARQAILVELAGAEHDLEQIFKQALTLGVQAVDNVDTDRELFVDGTRTIFNQAEFADLDSVREMFAFLEEKGRLLNLLNAALSSSSVQVSFCDEDSGLPGCSIVSAPYGSRNTAFGVISVIGPNRMNYSEVMPVLSCFSGALTRILQVRAQE